MKTVFLARIKLISYSLNVQFSNAPRPSLHVSVAQFVETASAGRIGYNPLGDVVKPEEFNRLVKKYTLIDIAILDSDETKPYKDLGHSFDSRFHWEIGKLYGYNDADIFRFLIRIEVPHFFANEAKPFPLNDFAFDCPITEYPEKTVNLSYARAVKCGLFNDDTSKVTQDSSKMYEETYDKNWQPFWRRILNRNQS